MKRTSPAIHYLGKQESPHRLDLQAMPSFPPLS